MEEGIDGVADGEVFNFESVSRVAVSEELFDLSVTSVGSVPLSTVAQR